MANKSPAQDPYAEESLRAPLATEDENDPNRQLEAEAREDIRKREERFREAEARRAPGDLDDAEVARGVETGGFLGGAKIVTSPGLRAENPDARFVPPRHSESGRWERDGEPVKAGQVAKAEAKQAKKALQADAKQQG